MAHPIHDLIASMLPGQRLEIRRIDDDHVEVTSWGPFRPRRNATVCTGRMSATGPMDGTIDTTPVVWCVTEAIADVQKTGSATPEQLAAARREVDAEA